MKPDRLFVHFIVLYAGLAIAIIYIENDSTRRKLCAGLDLAYNRRANGHSGTTNEDSLAPYQEFSRHQ